MPYAVTHIIITIVLADIYRDYISKRKFSMWYVLIAGIAGLLPDIDIPLSWMASFFDRSFIDFHRIFTHSVLWSLILFAIALLIYFINKREYRIFKWTVKRDALVMFFVAVGFGLFMHVLLDCTFSSDGLLTLIPGVPLTFCPHPFTSNTLIGLDAIILVLWLIHEQWKHKIRDYV